MKDVETIERLIDIGRQEQPDILSQLAAGEHLAALPQHIKIHDLEYAMPGRVRYRAALLTESITDFCRISLMTPGESKTCFIDQRAMSAKTIFNLGTLQTPGHGDHSATLKLKQTAAYKALISINGQQMSQKALAEWIEEWRSYITAQSGGEEMPLQKAITSIRTVTVEATQKREHVTGNFNAEKSDMEKIEAKGRDGALPDWLIFSCSPHSGLNQRDFYMRLSLLASGEPKFVLRIIQLEQHEEEMCEEFRQLLQKNLAEDLRNDAKAPDIFIGTIQL